MFERSISNLRLFSSTYNSSIRVIINILTLVMFHNTSFLYKPLIFCSGFDVKFKITSRDIYCDSSVDFLSILNGSIRVSLPNVRLFHRTYSETVYLLLLVLPRPIIIFTSLFILVCLWICSS